MFFIASTRFNNSTWQENIDYRIKNSIKGAIYGVNIQICEKYPLNSIIFVIEMNNDMNKICGISIIRNSILFDKKYKIYSDNNYNRFIYKGDYWLSRDDIIAYDEMLIVSLETMLFRGKSHLKRRLGISFLTSKLYLKWRYNEHLTKESIKNIFISKFKQSN